MASRTDLKRRRLGLSQAWETLAAGRRGATDADMSVRTDVLDSWRRSSEWVDPECPAAPLDSAAEVVAQWQAEPVAQALAEVEEEIRQVVADGELIAALADHRVAVPVYGAAESLNLGTAATVCLYASARSQQSAASS